MKKEVVIFSILLFLLPSTLADGGVILKNADMWNMQIEGKQYAAINYRDGVEYMLIAVDTNDTLKGEKAVWIFPVPANPNETIIDIMRGFPELHGIDAKSTLKDNILETFVAMHATQIYPFTIVGFGLGFIKTQFGAMEEQFGIGSGVQVFQTVEKHGMTTELISTADTDAFNNYLVAKNLSIPPEFRPLLEEYIGQDYAFVVSWIPDVEQFVRQDFPTYIQHLLSKGNLSGAREVLANWNYRSSGIDKYLYRHINSTLTKDGLNLTEIQKSISLAIRLSPHYYERNVLGVAIRFPTNKIYYPLKLTSVYGDTVIPINIFVLDIVEPELYQSIAGSTTVKYYLQERYSPPDELKDFFFGKNPLSNFIYTKIMINTNSSNFKEDLWLSVSTPKDLQIIYLIERYRLLWGIILFALLSCIASGVAGFIVFRKDTPSLRKFALLGLWNLLTLVGFWVASNKLKVDINFTKSKRIIKPNVVLQRVIVNSMFFSSMVTIIIFSYLYLFWLIFYNSVMFLLGVLLVLLVLITPLVWQYYYNKRILKFVLTFLITFSLTLETILPSYVAIANLRYVAPKSIAKT